MAYDPDVADRIRLILNGTPNLTEKRMFGGLAFLVNGHIAITANRRGKAMVRVNRDEADALINENVEVVEMRGRLMPGWLQITGPEIEESLETWVDRGLNYARSLPPKVT